MRLEQVVAAKGHEGALLFADASFEAVLQKRQGCSKLDGILRTERNRFHGYLQTVQMAPLLSRGYFALCPLTPSGIRSATEIWRR